MTIWTYFQRGFGAFMFTGFMALIGVRYAEYQGRSGRDLARVIVRAMFGR